ncbi:hypothetical protein GWI33_017222, partial [Rhynchophorus ferrugineus]
RSRTRPPFEGLCSNIRRRLNNAGGPGVSGRGFLTFCVAHQRQDCESVYHLRYSSNSRPTVLYWALGVRARKGPGL